MDVASLKSSHRQQLPVRRGYIVTAHLNPCVTRLGTALLSEGLTAINAMIQPRFAKFPIKVHHERGVVSTESE